MTPAGIVSSFASGRRYERTAESQTNANREMEMRHAFALDTISTYQDITPALRPISKDDRDSTIRLLDFSNFGSPMGVNIRAK